jgi:hypothetical protein
VPPAGASKSTTWPSPSSDRLDAEAGGDIHVFCEQLRAWSAAHPHTGPVVKNAEDLRRYREEREKEALLLREKPPGYGGSK